MGVAPISSVYETDDLLFVLSAKYWIKELNLVLTLMRGAYENLFYLSSIKHTSADSNREYNLERVA